MPDEFLAANRHLVAVVRNDGELVGKILSLDSRPNDAFGLSIDGDRFEDKPSLHESVGIRDPSGGSRTRQEGREAGSCLALCHSQGQER